MRPLLRRKEGRSFNLHHVEVVGEGIRRRESDSLPIKYGQGLRVRHQFLRRCLCVTISTLDGPDVPARPFGLSLSPLKHGPDVLLWKPRHQPMGYRFVHPLPSAKRARANKSRRCVARRGSSIVQTRFVQAKLTWAVFPPAQFFPTGYLMLLRKRGDGTKIAASRLGLKGWWAELFKS